MKFDLQVTVTVEALTEEEAEARLEVALQDVFAEDRNITHWEFTEFVPSDLSQSCCC